MCTYNYQVYRLVIRVKQVVDHGIRYKNSFRGKEETIEGNNDSGRLIAFHKRNQTPN